MRYVCGAYLTKIIAQKQRTLLIVQSLIDSKVAKVKEDVAHACILPIEDPDGVPIINEVAGKQIIVAGLGLMQRTERLFDLFHQRKNQGQRVGECHSMFKR